MTENDMLHGETFAERRRLGGLLAGLTPEQWASASLCEGWRVREVVAHLTMPYRLAPRDFYDGLSRHHGDFNRFADQEARETTDRMGDGELLEVYLGNVEHPWLPPGGGQAGALSHEVIHGLDITDALGLPAAPAVRIGTVIANAGPKNLEFFGTNLDGTSLVATDVDVTLGAGTPRRLPAKEILLAITGRRQLS